MAQTEDNASPEAIEDLKKTLKESNDDRKRDRLRREVQRANEYRIKIWAQSELKIRGALADLEVLGGEPPVLLEPDFKDNESLNAYAAMTLTK